mmetsp:Transcript_11928/g.17813  ORF Transcript_11928/g.17813 Transcript_11928/m.17813 type:complete len:681 (-) Transcript_11928:616-2658(-)
MMPNMTLSCRRRRWSSAASGFVLSLLLATATGSGGVNVDESVETEAPMSTEQFRRHLETTSAETFAHWTSDRSTKAIPLDLKLRSSDTDGSAYLAGHGSYAQFFVQGTQDNSTSTESNEDNEVIRSRYLLGAKIPVLNDVNKVNVEGGNTGAMRVHKLEETSSKGLRGQRRRQQNGEQALRNLDQGTISLDSIRFTKTDASFLHDADAQDYVMPSSFSGRELKRNNKKDRNKMKEESDNTNKKNKESGQKNGNKKNKQKNNKRPQITSFSPSAEVGIRDSQDFSIDVEPSPITEASIANVLFQITDPKGESSSWIEVPKIGKNRYQLTIDGFAKHKGTKWRYRVKVVDTTGKKDTTGVIMVAVNGVGDTNDRFVDDSTSTEAPVASPASESPPSPAQAMRKQVISDKNWPHGGNIQLATGKILFEFRGQGDFVCSGTVIMDGSNGSSPNGRNGRSIIQTAAHCVYNDVLKEFATKAMFVPDQVSTKGVSSNANCDDDKLGCWKLSFGVVADGWAESEFPENVGYDYAYYVVHDDPETTHVGGYLRELTGILDHDVDAVKIDFDYREKDFTFALGYSSEHDPNYRYCSMHQSTIFGVSWFENLWLDQCGLGSGASGGPWIADMDENGVGTLFSINSWGFDDKIGMAGPSLRTQDGSLAECLFQKAVKAKDPGKKGGLVVSC